VQGLVGTIAATIEHLRAGKLRALGVTTAMRSGTCCGRAYRGGFRAGYEASGWFWRWCAQEHDDSTHQ